MAEIRAELLEKAVELAAKVGHIFVATADSNGWPHVAAAGRSALTPEKHLIVTEWFCPSTMANLQINPRLSLVVWDSSTDVGFQLVCELEEIKDLGMLDGYPHRLKVRALCPR